MTDDILFDGAARALQELGIAEKLRIVTAANRSQSRVIPPFPHTRFEFDPQVDAASLANLLQQRLEGGAPPERSVPQPFDVVHAEPATEQHAPQPLAPFAV